MIFLRQLAADFVELLRIFQRTDRQRCCKKIITALCRQPRRFPQPQLVADKAALSALRTVLQPFRRLEKFFRLVSALQKCDLVQHFRPFRLFIQRAHQTF